MSEWVRVDHSIYFTTGPDVSLEVETWYCCRPWPIVVSTLTRSTTDHDAMPKREAWFVRECKLCGEYPRPEVRNG